MRILAVTTLRNEAPFVVEWVAHMRAIGVTDLLVYTNDCDDGTDQLLAVLAWHGELHHIVQKMPQGISPQWQALKAAWRHPLRKLCDWAVVCDVDEFINVHLGAGSLHDLISAEIRSCKLPAPRCTLINSSTSQTTAQSHNLRKGCRHAALSACHCGLIPCGIFCTM